MSENLGFYKCEICGNIVQVFHSGFGELVCCRKPMTHLEPKTNEPEIGEKHIPIFIENDGITEVKIGSIPHPMTNEHYIEFIEVLSNDKHEMHIKFLHPEQEPTLQLRCQNDFKNAFEYCNIHGLWLGENTN